VSNAEKAAARDAGVWAGTSKGRGRGEDDKAIAWDPSMAGLAEPLGRICLADFGNYDDRRRRRNYIIPATSG